MDNTIEIEVKTKGMEKVQEDIEELGDALDMFPAQVQFKKVQNCTINVYPSQTYIQNNNDVGQYDFCSRGKRREDDEE